MTREEAKKIFLNRGYIEVEGGTIYDADKWRESCRVISEWLEQEPCEDTISRQNDILPNIDKKVESYGELLKHPVIKHIMGMDETQEQLDFVQSHKQIPVTLTVSGDLISRQAVLDAFGFSEKTRKWCGDHSGYNTMMLYEIQDVIESQPPVKPQERTGHWILKTEDWNKWICSECGHTERTDIHVTLGYDFCPKCGANMSENPTS